VTVEALLRAATLRLARADGGPSLVRARAAALRAVLGVLLRRRHLAEALDALAPDDVGPPATSAARHRVLEALGRWPVTCLWRALAGYAALRGRGEPVRFVIGVRATADELVAHAWLERDGAPLGERADPRSRFAVAFVHPGPAPAVSQERPVPDPLAPPDVILTELQDGTGVLLHLGTKFYYALNRTGVAVWKLVERGVVAPDALAREIAAGFDGVSEAQARADVAALLAELRAEGLLPDVDGR
jgi:hypothetical protein